MKKSIFCAFLFAYVTLSACAPLSSMVTPPSLTIEPQTAISTLGTIPITPRVTSTAFEKHQTPIKMTLLPEDSLKPWDKQALESSGWSYYNFWDKFPRTGEIQKIMGTKDNTIWVLSEPSIMRIRSEGDWTLYEAGIDIPSATAITDMDIDPNGKVWVATKEGFLSFFDGNQWKNLSIPTGQAPKSPITSLSIAPNGDIWVGAVWVGRYDGNEWKWFPCGAGLPCSEVLFVRAAADGRVWAVTKKGLSFFDGKEWTPYRVDAYAFVRDDSDWTAVTDIATAPDGSIWLINYEGKSAAYLVVSHIVTGMPDEIYNYQAGMIDVSQQGTVWLGSFDSFVLAKFENEQWVTLGIHPMDFYLDNQPEAYTDLPFRWVRAIYEDADKNLWVGTELGIFYKKNR